MPIQFDNVYTKTEWFDVCRQVEPDMTWEEFEELWDEFQQAKEKHYAAKRLN